MRGNLAFRQGLPHKNCSRGIRKIRMIDYAAARRMMVDGQVRTNDVTDLRLQAAMLDVPREMFVPPARRSIAYLDVDVPFDGTAVPRALLKPMLFAKLAHAAEIAATDKVLDVGCATGYGAAVLARLGERVVALEQDAGLGTLARRALADCGVDNAIVATGELTAGWPAEAPYDVILIEGAIEVAPEALLRQLSDGGRLIAVVGSRPMGKATRYRSDAGHITVQPLFDAAAPLLPGFAKATEFVF
jgi:protein-L-isoaspartate(D-aspartate) O-methyltransferase